MKEEELAVFSRFRLLEVEGGNNSFASSVPIAFNTAIPKDKGAKQNKEYNNYVHQ